MVSIAQADWADLTAGLAVTVSIGASTAPRDGVERSALLRAADRNLYAAKRGGRDRVVSTSWEQVRAGDGAPRAIG